MKKKYITYAGIAAAVILLIIFIAILSTGSFTFFPTASIDPVPDHAAGDMVVITGTTNYPAGTRLDLDIVSIATAAGEPLRAGGTDAYIVRGGGMTNTWSGALDTAGIPPGEYRINAYWVDETRSPTFTRSGLLAAARLKLTNATPDSGKLTQPLMNHTLTFIHIDRPGTIKRGEKILVSGTTNLPVNTALLYLVVQQSNKSVFTVDPKTGQQDLKSGFTRSGLVEVMPGENGVSRWSFAVDSTEFIPDTYQIVVTLETISPKDIGRVGPFETESLVVLESDADHLTSVISDTGPCQSITIDTLPPIVARQKYTLTGTTSLQPGTELLFQILPVEYSFSINGNHSLFEPMVGAMGMVSVTPSAAGVNTWSADVDLAQLPPKEYLMNISNDRIDPRTYSTINGDRYCSKRFTLSG